MTKEKLRTKQKPKLTEKEEKEVDEYILKWERRVARLMKK